MYRKSSKLKIILSSVLVMVLIICLGLDIWHGWIRLLAPEKEIHNTYLIGKQKVNTLNPETGEEVAVSEPFFEVNVYNNAFELKINELFDETQSGFYSHGLQYISKDGKEFTFSNNVNIESASNLSSHISSVLKKQISLKENYTFIEDIVGGICSAIEYNKTPYEIINLGGGSPVTLNQMIETIEEVLGKKAIINRLPMQPGDVDKTVSDITKARNLLNYNPQTSFKEGIKKFVEWRRGK